MSEVVIIAITVACIYEIIAIEMCMTLTLTFIMVQHFQSNGTSSVVFLLHFACYGQTVGFFNDLQIAQTIKGGTNIISKVWAFDWQTYI